MKRARFAPILLVLLVLLAACGTTPEPDPEPSPNPLREAELRAIAIQACQRAVLQHLPEPGRVQWGSSQEGYLAYTGELRAPDFRGDMVMWDWSCQADAEPGSLEVEVLSSSATPRAGG